MREITTELSTIENAIDRTVRLVTVATLAANLADNYKLELLPICPPQNLVVHRPSWRAVFVYSATELWRTDTLRAHKFFLLFAQHGRCARRVTITAVAHTTTALAFDGVCKPSSSGGGLGYLESKFESLLVDVQDQLQNAITNVEVDLFENVQHGLDLDHEHARIIEDVRPENFEGGKGCLENQLKQLPFFNETDINVVSYDIHYWMLIQIGSRRLLEKRISFGAEAKSDLVVATVLWQSIQPLLAARGCQFVAVFAGLVLDAHGKKPIGCLVEYPEHGSIGFLLKTANKAGLRIPWKWKEKWIHQLIMAVAEAHERGSVIGLICPTHIRLDKNDNIVLLDFVSMSDYLRGEAGAIPPEFRKENALSTTNATPSRPLTSASDVFALGMCIWQLAEQRANSVSIFCRNTPCTSQYWYRCTAPHSNPIELPPHRQSLGIPGYITEIIDRCRQREPSLRSTASSLLQLLPQQTALETLEPCLTTSYDPSDTSTLTSRCDECDEPCVEEVYSCDLCGEGEFYLCADCFGRSVPCHGHHRLHRRIRRSNKWVSADGY